ncbi:MAG: D-alanyl-D-alanine carboxypeptidase family protein [Oscillospiraceae bacterium]
MFYKKLSLLLASILLITNLNVNIAQGASLKDVSASAAILYNMNTDEVLYSKNIDKQLPMASTTKIMTALILFEQDNLDEEFIVDAEAIKVEGSSMGLLEGDTVTLRTLGYGLLLKSGNDAAGAVATRIAGSKEKFANMMNQKAKEFGMLNTNFVTPSGLHDDEHYSTALDMAILTKQALLNNEFKKACGTNTAKLSYGNPPYDRYLSNSNKLLKQYDGAIGVKTGFTTEAGRCLVSAAKKDDDTLIVVTLKASDDWNVHKNLLDYGFSMKKDFSVNKEDYDLSLPIKSGDKFLANIGIEENVNIKYLASSDNITSRIFLEKYLVAPLHKNQVVGNVQFMYNGGVLKEVPIISKEDIAYHTDESQSILSKIMKFFGFNK